MVIDLNVNVKTIRLLGENIGEKNLIHPGFHRDLLNRTQSNKETKSINWALSHLNSI